MFVVKKQKGETSSLPAKELDRKQMKALTSKLAKDILKVLAEDPTYSKDIARKLKVHEQKVYYHIRKLEKARIIEIIRTETVGGAQANIYGLVEPAFCIKFKEFETTQRLVAVEEEPKQFLMPFIEDGKLKATIVVGSPDPHGPEKARSRDGYYGIDLALFLGTFLNYVSNLHVKLDTEVTSDDLKENLILVGGPVVNTITGKINSRLPVRFEKRENWAIHSTISKRSYMTDETGMIVKTKNPFNKKKSILVVAGKRYMGTRAVMIAFIKHFKDLIKGNKYGKKVHAKVVEGVDLDSDGVVDDVEILE